MPLAQIRGVNINYEVLGDTGPWVALSPGGRRSLEAVKSLAARVAAAGYRVLIHDRRNCGASDIVIDGDDKTHLREVGENLHRIMTQSELHILFPGHVDVDLVPPEEWNTKETEQAAIFLNFLQRSVA